MGNNEEKVVVKEKQKINTISLFVLIVGIIFIAVGSVLTITSIDNNESNNQNNSENDNIEEDKELKEINITDKELNALESLPIITANMNYIPRYSVYQSKKVNAQEVDIDILVANAIDKMSDKNDCTIDDVAANNLCDFTYNLENVKNKIKELYGDFNFELPTKFSGSFLLKCTQVNDHYACSNSGGGFSSPYWQYFNFMDPNDDDINLIKNIKAETDGTNIYIYQEFARINLKIKNTESLDTENDLNNYEFRAYKYSDTDELLTDKVFIGKDYYEENPNATPFLTKMENELNGKLTTFKHTFKITENDSYVWVSTEEVK